MSRYVETVDVDGSNPKLEEIGTCADPLPGPKGDKGDLGPPGASVKGDKGDKGDAGIAIGIKGDKGDKGDPGVAVNLKGDKGDPGESGASVKGDKGDPGEPGVAVAIKGDKGDKGDTVVGPPGPAGPPGRDAGSASLLRDTLPVTTVQTITLVPPVDGVSLEVGIDLDVAGEADVVLFAGRGPDLSLDYRELTLRKRIVPPGRAILPKPAPVGFGVGLKVLTTPNPGVSGDITYRVIR